MKKKILLNNIDDDDAAQARRHEAFRKFAEENLAQECSIKEPNYEMRILIRNNDDEIWQLAYTCTTEDLSAKYNYYYVIIPKNTGKTQFKLVIVRQCIPYNEKTWNLLGTANPYVEE